MHDQPGRTLPLSLPRRFITDLVHFARKVPTVPVQRVMDVGAVRAARELAAPRPSWCAIFTKAYAQAAAEIPELRRAFLPFPWARLYEHPINIASVAMEREYRGERAVFFAHLRSPDQQSLRQLDEHLRRFKEQPVESIGLYRRALAVSRLPQPLRRLMWWIGLNSSGFKRARRIGTFGVSVYAALGAESLHPLSPLTTALNYGVIQPEGRVNVRLIYDHRVMDGATVARALGRMEEILRSEILDELKSLCPPDALRLREAS
jgi:hypothetical protein